MNKTIVTGGAGFIGSHLVELLLNKGFTVLCIDNMANGQWPNVEMFRNNSSPHYSPNYQFYQLDLAEPFDDSLFKDTVYVFHLAGLADIVPSIEQPLKYHQANVDGTIRVLEACRKYQIKKLVFSASSTSYGIPDTYPTPEDAPMKPAYPYAFTKYIAEQYVLFWHKLYKLPVVSLRYFNVYGPRGRTNSTYGAVFKVFLTQKLHGQPLTIVGDGRQTRDFTYVTDIANANFLAAESEVSGEIINIGTGKPHSVNYLAALIGGETTTIPKRPGEPESTHADITKAIRLLGWKPLVSFEEGVRSMLDNIGYWREAPLWNKESIQEATKEWFRYLSRDSIANQNQAEQTKNA